MTSLLTTFGEALGARLRNLREEKELTIEELAKRMSGTLDPKAGSGTGGIEASTISQIELGEIETVSAPVLAAFARALGTTVEALERLNPGEGGEGRFEAQPAVDGHDAEQASDGTWSIRDVPIFSMHVDDRGEEPEEYGLPWLEGALSRANTRAAEGYLGPLHVGHHPSEGVEGAGRFRLTGIRELIYEGAPTPTLFADFLEIPDEQYQRLKSGELPYRSVEIHGPDKHEVLSVALLDDEVPFFRYSNMRIRQETKHKPKKRAKGVSYSALVSRTYELGGTGRRVLTFNFAGASMATPETTTTSTEHQATETPGKKFNLDNAVEAAREGLALMGAAIEQIAEIAGEGNGDDAAAPEENAPVEMAAVPAAPVATPLVAEVRAAIPPQVAGELAALRSQVARLSNTAGSELDAERRELAAAGAPEADLRQFTALATESGPKAAQAYARAMRVSYASLPADPPQNFAAVTAPTSADPACVLAYSDQGPEIMEQARQLYSMWGRGTKRHKPETYLEAHLAPGNFLPTASRVNGN